MVASVLGLAEPPRPPDVADALALAACHLTSQLLRRATAAAESAAAESAGAESAAAQSAAALSAAAVSAAAVAGDLS